VHARASDGAADAAPAKKRRRDKGKEQQQQQQHKGGRKGRPAKDEEFGVTRGIDFKGVQTIVNYDLPASVQGARAGGGRQRGGPQGAGGADGAALLHVLLSGSSCLPYWLE
jgi:ATP-dependent RNA helicase DDX56/DBP9